MDTTTAATTTNIATNCIVVFWYSINHFSF